jgi:hypothetical protein
MGNMATEDCTDELRYYLQKIVRNALIIDITNPIPCLYPCHVTKGFNRKSKGLSFGIGLRRSVRDTL